MGGTVSISRTSNAFSISLGLGFSAATGHVHHVFCGGPPTIGPFACGGSVAAAFTIFCKERLLGMASQLCMFPCPASCA